MPLSFVAAALVVAVLSALFVTACSSQSSKTSSAEAEFVGRQACASCHQDQTHAWEGSHHDLAMDPANDSTVLGEFHCPGVRDPRTYRFGR